MKCARCKLEIDTKKEKYVRITDFEREKNLSEIHLHILCWKNIYAEKITSALQSKIKDVMTMFQ